MGRIGFLFLLLAAGSTAAQAAALKDVRVWGSPDSTRVVLDLTEPATYTLFTLSGPERIVIDFDAIDADLGALGSPAASGVVKGVRFGARGRSGLRVVIDVDEKVEARGFLTPPNETYGHRLVVDLGHAQPAMAHAPAPVKVAGGDGQRNLVIAIDPGHGGEDPGAIGKAGTREKTVALAIAKKLADRINEEPGMSAVLTRTGDYFVKFKDRIGRARTNRADLFVSVHADAFMDRSVRGSSVYVLSTRRASSEAAKTLADRENAADLIGGVSLHDKSDVLATVLLDLSQNAAISASRDAASRVLAQLDTVGRLKKSDVQHASLIVLTSPDVPSMLVETAFISNPDEERKLRDPAHQARLAEAIHGGIRRYFYDNPPPGTHVAVLAARERGQALRHVVSPGETLVDVAGRYAVGIDDLRRRNHLETETIASGTILEIPVAGT
ncbi:MAG TPA: N-acetylmuramoyl-L-alanine amidase [Steroidobacteraceae bacterium]|nr:N-acetylmuramoyl-L-alanine amidase [Steroidobacteraceae bacterium]